MVTKEPQKLEIEHKLRWRYARVKNALARNKMCNFYVAASTIKFLLSLSWLTDY